MKDTNTPLFSLSKEKSELKRQIKFAKQKVDSQKKQIEIQTERAKNGLSNTLAFEQSELPKFLSELLNLEKQLDDLKIDIKIAETQPSKITNELIPHNSNDKDGFPINALGSQICLLDGNGNVFIPLHSNLFITIQEKAGIQFNPKDKLEVNLAVDTLVNILTHNFYKKLEDFLTLDLSDEYKKTNNVRTKAPVKILFIQIYFDWINKWLKYFGNVFNFEFKLLFYSKYKEKIKNDILSLETGLKEINAPKSHIDFAKRWIEETDKNIDLETKAKDKKGSETFQEHSENTMEFNFNNFNTIATIKTLFPNITLESILNKQNNLLPKVSIQEVYNHFNILTTSTNKNNQFYLTNEQLLVFILSTFIEQKPIKQDFNCEGFVKKDIRKIFFDFYFKNKNKETNQTRLKRKYFNIMNNAFNGFNENDYTDFAK